MSQPEFSIPNPGANVPLMSQASSEPQKDQLSPASDSVGTKEVSISPGAVDANSNVEQKESLGPHKGGEAPQGSVGVPMIHPVTGASIFALPAQGYLAVISQATNASTTLPHTASSTTTMAAPGSMCSGLHRGSNYGHQAILGNSSNVGYLEYR